MFKWVFFKQMGKLVHLSVIVFEVVDRLNNRQSFISVLAT